MSITNKIFTNLVKQHKTFTQVNKSFFAAKELSFGTEARKKMLRGCENLADAV
jgi:hypothetical protein